MNCSVKKSGCTRPSATSPSRTRLPKTRGNERSYEPGSIIDASLRRCDEWMTEPGSVLRSFAGEHVVVEPGTVLRRGVPSAARRLARPDRPGQGEGAQRAEQRGPDP